MRTGRIALLHLATAPAAVERNQYVIVEAIKRAAAVGARWIVTPELAVCGLQFPRIIGVDWIKPQPDLWMQRLCRLMKELQCTLFIGCPEREGSRLYNSVFVINTRGEIIGRHRKLNVASDALSWSSPGGDVVPIECDGIRVGILVCSDAYTQNIARALRFGGAQIYVSPASWGPGIHGPNGEWEARTQETGLPLIVCNRTGAERTLEFWKAPSLVVANGERVLSHTSDQSVILMFDWDFSSMKLRSAGYQTEYVKAR